MELFKRSENGDGWVIFRASPAGGPGFSIRMARWGDPWAIDDAKTCVYTVAVGLFGIRGVNAPWAGVQLLFGPFNFTLLWITDGRARRGAMNGTWEP